LRVLVMLLEVVEGVLVAAPLDAALKTVAPRTPPRAKDPATMAATTPFRPRFIRITSFPNSAWSFLVNERGG